MQGKVRIWKVRSGYVRSGKIKEKTIFSVTKKKLKIN
jgi:hypothetical protein